jgi:uncharacterized membrane protein
VSFASLCLVVLAAFVHATWNLLSKRAAAAGPTFIFTYNLVACVAYAPWVLWLLARDEIGWSWAVAGCVLISGLIANLLRFCLLAPVVARKPARAYELMQGNWWRSIGVGLLSPLSYILVLAALGLGAPVSAVAPAREMSMMVGALFGLVILRERVGAWRLIGCAVLIIGVVMLGVS